ncbi:hypothetical protein [uncultured Xanthomonas sp.]|uniref:hypothetical protein n=1 Tax=uncultured Xanthomonas sp. TaxID=152831 RepID=UPI0025CBF10D|nr:hypothetical protein [uncultured Xanthomonas sp.]
MSNNIQKCLQEVRATLTNLSNEEIELVKVYFKYGRNPEEIIDLIRQLRWHDAMAKMRKVNPPLTDDEINRAKALTDQGSSAQEIVDGILAGRSISKHDI